MIAIPIPIDSRRRAQPEAIHYPAHSHQVSGHVVAVAGSGIVTEVDGLHVRARRAASCLLQPRPGDEVWVARLDDGRAYVLSILERSDTSSAELSIEGDVSFQAPSGRLRMVASEGLEMISPKAVSVTTSRFELVAGGARMLVAGALETVAECVVQQAKRAYRTIDDIEQVRVGQLDISAKDTLRMHAKNALVTAMSLVKVDGKQIHMG